MTDLVSLLSIAMIPINIAGKPSYNTSPYAYSLIWGKNRASPGFYWGMENLSDCSELMVTVVS